MSDEVYFPLYQSFTCSILVSLLLTLLSIYLPNVHFQRFSLLYPSTTCYIQGNFFPIFYVYHLQIYEDIVSPYFLLPHTDEGVVPTFNSSVGCLQLVWFSAFMFYTFGLKSLKMTSIVNIFSVQFRKEELGCQVDGRAREPQKCLLRP